MVALRQAMIRTWLLTTLYVVLNLLCGKVIKLLRSLMPCISIMVNLKKTVTSPPQKFSWYQLTARCNRKLALEKHQNWAYLVLNFEMYFNTNWHCYVNFWTGWSSIISWLSAWTRWSTCLCLCSPRFLKAPWISFYETGGVRGAAFVHSPLLASKGRVSMDLIHVTDWVPTLYELAGGNSSKLHNVDGFNMWSTLSSGESSPRKELLHNIHPSGGAAAMRYGQWKVVVNAGQCSKCFSTTWYPFECWSAEICCGLNLFSLV